MDEVSLKFNAASHRYWMDGKPVKGATSLMKMPQPFLIDWAARTVAEYVADQQDEVRHWFDTMERDQIVGALKGVHNVKRDKAAVRGTDVHALAERVVHGEDVEVPEHLVDHVEGYARWLDAFQVKPILTERSVGNRKHWYAGRFDLIASIAPGPTWLLDVKTSTSVYGETGLQLAAYANAEFYVNDDDPDAEYPMPVIDRHGVLHVTDAGTTLYPYDSSDLPWRLFLHAAYINKHTDAIKAFKHDAVYDLSELETA
jgi:hypothetical protein